MKGSRSAPRGGEVAGSRVEQDFDTLEKLAREHGDAYYLIDVDRFRANLHDLVEAFRRIYPTTSLGYSYKTNYLPLLCRLARDAGCYAEVTSKTEYDLALRVGVAPDGILFNGPIKEPREIDQALRGGAILNVDSSDEIEAIESLARRTPSLPMRVGIRCNFALAPGHTSRFGIAADGDEMRRAIERLRGLPRSEVGLHCHFAAHRDVDSFRTRTQRLCEIARRHFPDGSPAFVDVGGGFFGRMPESLRAQFGTEIPTYTDYADAVAGVMAAAFPDAAGPELILEPGAAVVADAVRFVCRVAVVKRLGAREVVITTGSVQNIKAKPSPIRLPLEVVPDPSGGGTAVTSGPIDLTGYTCMEFDVLYPGYEGELRVGDFLVFENVGAYTSVFKPPFIRPAPAMIAWSRREGAFQLARRREGLDDFLATYL